MTFGKFRRLRDYAQSVCEEFDLAEEGPRKSAARWYLFNAEVSELNGNQVDCMLALHRAAQALEDNS